MYDGYATVDFGRWHFHLCIGEHKDSGPELGRIRRCSRAELYRRIGKDGSPTSWGVRLFNGRDDQLMTLMLPSPFLTNIQQLRAEPAFAALELWDRLRSSFLGLEHGQQQSSPRHDLTPCQIAAAAMPSPIAGSNHQMPGQTAATARPTRTAAACAPHR